MSERQRKGMHEFFGEAINEAEEPLDDGEVAGVHELMDGVASIIQSMHDNDGHIVDYCVGLAAVAARVAVQDVEAGGGDSRQGADSNPAKEGK